MRPECLSKGPLRSVANALGYCRHRLLVGCHPAVGQLQTVSNEIVDWRLTNKLDEASVREALEAARSNRAGPPEDWAAEIAERVQAHTTRSLQPVLNATGVVLHTNLGRAPLAHAAAVAIQEVAEGYGVFDLYPDGTFDHQYITYGWTQPKA